MPEIGIGIVGGGYMGKAHAVAYASVGAQFETRLRPRLAVGAATTPESAERYRAAYGFARATADWRNLVADPAVGAVVIASRADTHWAIPEAACALGKQVLCEKPLGASVEDGRDMVAAAEAAGVPNMVGFNYVRTPATQFARRLIAEGALGEITWFRAEHTEDFLADPATPANWRTSGEATGTLGDLAPHALNATLALMGPVAAVMAEIETRHATRPGSSGPQAVTNDDLVQLMCRFANGAQGHVFSSRIATGRKMGYAYEVHGTKGALRFDQEDQNALWLYRAEGAEATRGFVKILTGPAHPDYAAFCQGPGHGTGYQDQIVIEARDFLAAIETGRPVWPTFRDGHEVNRLIAAIRASARKRAWVSLDTIPGGRP